MRRATVIIQLILVVAQTYGKTSSIISKTSGGVSAVWFRRGLRLHDNAPLVRACELGNVVPVFILDPHFVQPWRIGVNQFSFFREGLMDLDEQLQSAGSRLIVLRGKPETVWESVFNGEHSFKVKTLLWEQDTTPYSLERDEAVAEVARRHGVAVETFPGHTLLDVSSLIKQPGFQAPTTNAGAEKLVEAAKIPAPLSSPKIPPLAPGLFSSSYEMFTLQELGYESEPTHVTRGGEREGLKILRNICSDGAYVRNFDKTKTASTTGHSDSLSTTGLSPYLMCGAVSVRTMYHDVQAVLARGSHTKAPASLLGQLYFREMFYLLSATTPNYDKAEGNPYCLYVKWGNNSAFLRAWEEGQTGYPYIDGLMRQLKETGWIHHLGRHALACFLTRGDLWQHWTYGRDVFAKLLLDSDGAANNGNWLALAGVAPWSAPWFRVYSPIPEAKSSLNVAMDGAWLKRFVPELRDMPTKYIFKPWTAPKSVQETAKCVIGKDYPAPIVDHTKARDENLKKFKQAVDDRKQEREKRKALEAKGGADNKSKKSKASSKLTLFASELPGNGAEFFLASIVSMLMFCRYQLASCGLREPLMH